MGRCARNCFDCPICFSQLSVNNINGAIKEGPWILNCYYCMWTSLDIGIKFDRPTNIRAQLDKIANGGKPKAPSRPAETPDLTRRPSYLSRESYSRTSTTTEGPPTNPTRRPYHRSTSRPSRSLQRPKGILQEPANRHLRRRF